MVGRPPDREIEEVADPIDPITGKPVSEERLHPLVLGTDEEAVELDDEITGPEDLPVTHRDRSDSGVQLIAHVEDPKDISGMLPKLREQWRNARKDLGLDD